MTSDDIRTEIRNLVLNHDAEGLALRLPKLTNAERATAAAELPGSFLIPAYRGTWPAYRRNAPIANAVATATSATTSRISSSSQPSPNMHAPFARREPGQHPAFRALAGTWRERRMRSHRFLSRVRLRQVDAYRSGIKHGGDGFDLNELVVVTEHGDSHQGARYVMLAERVPDYLPGSPQILLPGGRDENPCADDVPQRCAGGSESRLHVLDGFRCLARVVPDRCRRSVLVQGTRSGEEDES